MFPVIKAFSHTVQTHTHAQQTIFNQGNIVALLYRHGAQSCVQYTLGSEIQTAKCHLSFFHTDIWAHNIHHQMVHKIETAFFQNTRFNSY